MLDHVSAFTVSGSDPNAPLRGADQGALGAIADAAILIVDGKVAAIGPRADVLDRIEPAHYLDLGGRVATPGLVDAHTHPVWAGTRVDEFARRVAGAGYVEIAAAGGGIGSTVRSTRAATTEALVEATVDRIRQLTAHGATTVEAKTGYGLRTDEEMRHLQVLRTAATRLRTRVVPTFLGAHALPPEFAGRSGDYINVVVNEMLPAVAASDATVFVDVFCDEGAFTVAETRRVLERARELGLRTKAHSDEFANLGCTAAAADLGATSVDHLVATTPAEMASLARSGTVAVLLPGTTFGLGSSRYAPARDLVAHGVPVALGTDLNPGTCPSPNLALVMAMATRYLRLSPAEALVGFTRNAAHACGCGDVAGQLVRGRDADIAIFDTDDYRDLAYLFGGNPVWAVMIAGEWAVAPPGRS